MNLSLLLSEVKNLSDDQLFKKYKIVVNTDGTVYDKKFKHHYQTVMEWINTTIDKSYTTGKITE